MVRTLGVHSSNHCIVNQEKTRIKLYGLFLRILQGQTSSPLIVCFVFLGVSWGFKVRCVAICSFWFASWLCVWSLLVLKELEMKVKIRRFLTTLQLLATQQRKYTFFITYRYILAFQVWENGLSIKKTVNWNEKIEINPKAVKTLGNSSLYALLMNGWADNQTDFFFKHSCRDHDIIPKPQKRHSEKSFAIAERTIL